MHFGFRSFALRLSDLNFHSVLANRHQNSEIRTIHTDTRRTAEIDSAETAAARRILVFDRMTSSVTL
jgi:hypothetical protein